MFEIHVSIIEASWMITLIDGAHIVNYIHHIQGGVPPWLTSHLFPILETLGLWLVNNKLNYYKK